VIAIDTNVLVAAHRADHPHHRPADAALRELCVAAIPWALPWPCVHEFLGNVTHPRIWPVPTPVDDACEAIDRWRRLPSVHTLAESDGYWPILQDLVRFGSITGPRIHDARTRKGEVVVVKDQAGTLADVRIKDLHHLAVFGSAQVSTALIQTLCEKEVPVSYFSMGGWFYGLTRGHGLTNVFTRIQQFAFAADPEKALPLARLFVYGKIRNQRTLFMRNHVEPPPVALRALRNAASAALVAPNLPSLLGVEGAAALVYFQNFSGMIKGRAEEDDELPGLEESVVSRVRDAQKEFPFDFTTRNRRPPRDPVNAMLSLAYSLLARDCTVAALAVGFDPYVGLCHQPRFGRPALALDVMEEFRPLIADSVVLTAINNRMITPLDFVRAGDAVNLTPDGRKRFFLAYEKRLGDTVTHPLFDYKVSYRRAIELQFRLLARTLTGEIERYLPFMTR